MVTEEKINILVTGANGQLGNEIRLLAQEHTDYHYFFTDIQELDVCNESMINHYVEDHHIHLIINCAAFTAVDNAEKPENHSLCNKLNHLAPLYLAKAAQRMGAGIIHLSSDYVFDGESFIPYREDDRKHPTSVYGTTKLEGEIAVLSACERSVIIRTAWLYSIFGKNFVNTMLRLSKEKKELGVVFDQIGTPTYAHDLANAIFTIIGKGLIPGVYHFSNEGVCSWYDFAKAVHRWGGIHDCHIKPLHTDEYPSLAKRPAYSVLDKSKIKATYDIEIPQWEESVEHCINRMKNLEK